MKSKGKGVVVLVRVVFFLHLLPLLAQGISAPFLAQGQRSNHGSRMDELKLTSQAGAQDALQSLHDGQTLSLEVADVLLNETVTLTASNIVIRGTSGGSRIFCPSNGGAFVIKGRNVTLLRLEFTDCRKGSAIKTIGRHAGHTPRNERNNLDENSKRKDNSNNRAIFIQDCVFFRNKGRHGAAINAQRSRLIIRNTTFEINEVEGDGGAVHIVTLFNGG